MNCDCGGAQAIDLDAYSNDDICQIYGATTACSLEFESFSANNNKVIG